MIDLHSHLLPGLDDGPHDWDESLAMAAAYATSGFTTVIATPHFIRGSAWTAAPAKILAVVTELNERLQTAAIALQVLPGMEIAIDGGFWDLFKPGQVLPLAHTSTSLIEFPFQGGSHGTIKKFLAGMKHHQASRWLIAHPERCSLFQKQPTDLALLVKAGCLAQLNCGSILGLSGPTAQATALDLLEQGSAHIIATDSHGHGPRNVPSLEQWRQLADMLGPETLAAAVATNPQKLLDGQAPAPLEVEPRRLEAIRQRMFEDFQTARAKKPGLLSRLTR